MQKIRAVVRTRRVVLALLVLLAVLAHAAPIMLLASSFTPLQIFTNRDQFLATFGTPQLSFNFNNLADQRTNALNLTGLSISGNEFAIQSGMINFGLGFDAFGFGPGVFAFGADITPLGGGGLINFSFAGLEGLSRLINVTGTETQFLGFAAAAPFRAINISFLGPQSDTIFFSAPASPSSVNFVIDNVIANTVPEPTTLILLATGAGLLGLSHRRRKRADVDDAGRDGGNQADSM